MHCILFVTLPVLQKSFCEFLLRICWAAAEGGGNVSREFGGGGKRTAERDLQNHFWRPQKLGLVWSVPRSFKGNDTESPKGGGGGKRIVGRGGPKMFLGRRFTVCSPPPRRSLNLPGDLTLRKGGDFFVNFLLSPFPSRQSTKTLPKSSEQNSEENSGP